MNFLKFLTHLKSNNKILFKAEKIEITVSNFEKILKYTYEYGYKESDKFHNDLNKMGGNKNNNLSDLFGGIFGKK